MIVQINHIDLLPLKALVLYVLIGVLLSFFGPIAYVYYDKLPIVLYMSLFLLLFIAGYLLAFRSDIKNLKHSYSQENYRFYKVLFGVKLSIIIIVFVQLTTLVIGVSDGSLNLSVSKMGEAYINTYKDYVRGSGNVSLSFLIQTLTYVPYLVTLILGAFYFKQLPFIYKIFIIFIYISIIFIETIGHGKQKQLGDMFVFLSIVGLLKVNLLNKKVLKKILKRMFLFSVLGVTGLVTVLYFRYAALGVSSSNISEKVHPLMVYDTNHIIFKIFGDELGFPIAAFSGYLSQGYYGLSIAMKEPFVWTYFLGSSYSVSVFLQRFLGVPVDFHDTYPYRASLHSEWNDSKWSTVFTWFAGDFTFFGTLVLFSVIAFLYAKVWQEAYKYKNPISIVLFANLTIGLLYIPANNQLLHTPGSVIAMFIFVGLWILKHRKFNFYHYKEIFFDKKRVQYAKE